MKIDVHKRFDVGGVYMSSGTSIRPEYTDCFGLIEGAAKGKRTRFLAKGFPWVLDNGVYTGVFTFEQWIKSMEKLAPFRENCILVAIPDVLFNCRETLGQYLHYLPYVRERGYPAALVTQDGMTPEDIPWNDVDALFIGGSNDHKLGQEAAGLIEAGKEHGVWVHVGRVNSRKRMLLTWQADSWDGTAMSFEPDVKCRILGGAVREVRRKKGRHPNGLLVDTLRRLAKSDLPQILVERYPILMAIPDLDCMTDQGALEPGMIQRLYEEFSL